MQHYLTEFIKTHALPESYIDEASKNFQPLIKNIRQSAVAKKPLVVGINGCQGSGKSTLAAFLECELVNKHQLKVLSISLDDFYLAKDKRKKLAEKYHPLLATRGVPGTHNLDLAITTFQSLINLTQAKPGASVLISRFDKSKDDLHDIGAWTKISCPIDVIILEGWCVGSEPEPESNLINPINKLESEQDLEGVWRRYVNEKLKEYQVLFDFIDIWAMLKAPSFDCVYDWRLEQEEKLAKSLQIDKQTTPALTQRNSIMSAEQIAEFIQFYERITKHTLGTLPDKVDYLYRLDEQRFISRNLAGEPEIMDKDISDDIKVEYNNKAAKTVIFTDLDGSLLDHYDYSYQPAIKTLDRLAAESIPVIFATSKTFAELLIWNKKLNNEHPMIVENGSAIYIPKQYFSKKIINNLYKSYTIKEQEDFYVLLLSRERSHWNDLLQTLEKDYKDCFQTFSQMGTNGIVESTGLTEDAAVLANQRGFTEPVLWLASSEKKKRFIKKLRSLGTQVTEGGRFLHIMDNTDKGRALTILAGLYKDHYESKVETIAAGDGENDVQMLLSADKGILIKSPTHQFPKIPKNEDHIILSNNLGPLAWAEGIDKLVFSMSESVN